MKKNIYLAFIILFAFNFTNNLFSQESTFLSYGIKLGYQFGNDGGFVYGLELSVTRPNKEYILGGVLDIDFCKDKQMIHLGFEESIGLIGYDIGPTLYFKDHKIIYGGTANLFTAVYVLPFYGYSYFPKEKISINQIGTYLKIHKLIYGEFPNSSMHMGS